MTRGLWCAAWIFSVVAWAGLLAGWRDVLVACALVSAAAWLAWGYRLHPDPDPDEWQAEETEAVKMSNTRQDRHDP